MRGNNSHHQYHQDENIALVLSPSRIEASPAGADNRERLTYFGREASGGGGPHHHHQGAYGAFDKSSNRSATTTPAASASRGDTSTLPMQLHFLRARWPVVIELLTSYVIALTGFTSQSNPWAVGLVFAGLAHAISTGGYYLQANPILTLGQLLRHHITFGRAVMYWLAQLCGVALAMATFTLSNHGFDHEMELMLPMTACQGSLSYGQSLALLTVFSAIWVYIALSAWDSMALALESCCSFYGLATGAAYGSTMACIQSREIASGLLNTWVGVLAMVNAAAGVDGGGKGEGGTTESSDLSCSTLYVLGPLLGACIGALISWLTSLRGTEKEAVLRSISPIAPLLVETVGVATLVLTLASTKSSLPTGAIALALTLCAWRRSGAQFNPSITLGIFMLKRQMFRYTSLLFYILAQLAGAALGAALLFSLPTSKEVFPPLLQQPLSLGPRGSILLLVFSTTYISTFVANTDAEYDEGFLHPALMVGVTLMGLLLAASNQNILLTGLFNPAITVVVWMTCGASFGLVALGTGMILLASILTFTFFWIKNQVDH